MFLESTYRPTQTQPEGILSIYDVAILVTHVGHKAAGFKKHPTAGLVQLVCYFAQGEHIMRTGRSLFKEDFYVIDARIESPKVTELFGAWDAEVGDVPLDERKSLLSWPGFNTMNNALCKRVAEEIIPQDYKTLMDELRTTKPYIEALSDPYRKISKHSIKEYFTSKILKPTEITNITIGV